MTASAAAPPAPVCRVAHRALGAKRSLLRAAGGCVVAGLALALTFEFEALALLAPPAVAVFLVCAARASTRVDGALLGLVFGLACFGSALRWLYSLVDAASAPVLSALAPTAIVCALAATTALVGALAAAGRSVAVRAVALLLLAPAVWTLLDAVRHQSDWAFPWLSLGYSQAVASPLAALFPVGGVLLVGWAVALAGGALALAWLDRTLRARTLAALALALAACAALGVVEWSRPQESEVQVAVVQANVGERKFDAEALASTLSAYESLIRAVRADAIVLPESALPVPVQGLPGYLMALAAHARGEGTDVLVGTLEADGAQPGSYFSSALVIGPSGVQAVRKRYLVPFGEWQPASGLLARLYSRVQRVPGADQSRGADDQPVPVVAGGRVAVMICYEDLFGDRLRADAARAGWIANLGNDSWGDSDALRRQHARVAQARAREFARPTMRAADSGRSGWIDARGRWVEALPLAQVGALEATIRPHAGRTPYVWVGDRLAIGGAALLLLLAWLSSRRAPQPARCLPPLAEVR